MGAKSSGKRDKRPAVTPEERNAFLEAMNGVTPLGARDRLPVAPPPPSPVRPSVLPPEQKLTVDVSGATYSARAPGVSHAQIADLRKHRPEATLDLHGMTTERGVAELRKFLLASRGIRRCVLVVHGKGIHSDAGAPLRDAVIAELLGAASGLVHAFATASPTDGGEGATCVLLRGAK